MKHPKSISRRIQDQPRWEDSSRETPKMDRQKGAGAAELGGLLERNTQNRAQGNFATGPRTSRFHTRIKGRKETRGASEGKHTSGSALRHRRSAGTQASARLCPSHRDAAFAHQEQMGEAHACKTVQCTSELPSHFPLRSRTSFGQSAPSREKLAVSRPLFTCVASVLRNYTPRH